jgi:hypothetical protein
VSMDKNCPKCFGYRMGVRNPSLAWHQDLGYTCGAGMPCECNQVGEPGIDPPDYSELMTDERDIKEH